MAAQDIRKLTRTKKNKYVNDDGDAMSYNEVSGGMKNLNIGPYLVPINVDGSGKTTDASTIRSIPKGVTLYIYNKDTAVHAVRMAASNAATALAAGVVDATTKELGVPCKPGDYTILSNYDKGFIIADSNQLVVMMMLDGTRIIDESVRA